eukprot:10642291-Ditylum_brightwellii.AAC.1
MHFTLQGQIKTNECSNVYSALGTFKSITKIVLLEFFTNCIVCYDACEYRSSLDVIHAVLVSYPDAAKEKDGGGRTPLHNVCLNRPSVDVIDALLGYFPDAAKEKSCGGSTPLHFFTLRA